MQAKGVLGLLLTALVLVVACAPAAPQVSEPASPTESARIVLATPAPKAGALEDPLPAATVESTSAPALEMELLPQEATAPGPLQQRPSCVTPERATQLVGQTGCVEGQVTRLTYARNSRGSPTFLDFGNRFTAVIWIEDRPAFPEVDNWDGRHLRIRGPVATFRGKPQVILRRADQVEILPLQPGP